MIQMKPSGNGVRRLPLTNVQQAAVDVLPSREAARLMVIPRSLRDGVLVVGSPEKREAQRKALIDELVHVTGVQRIELEYVESDAIRDAYPALYPNDDRPAVTAAGDDSVGVRLWDDIQATALRRRASDIHIRPLPSGGVIRYNVDGITDDPDGRHAQRLSAEEYGNLVRRLKFVVDGFDIGEDRLPQDGRGVVVRDSVSSPARFALLPTVHGPKITVRVLKHARNVLRLNQIGMSQAMFERYLRAVNRPYGFHLVVGPTSHGKTSTLHAALLSLALERLAVVTIEDPIEAVIAEFDQLEVNESLGLTFLNLLSDVLRNAPNVIMVGETRDKETAETSIHAAITGHAMFTSSHAATAALAPQRIIGLGVRSHDLAAAISTVLAQRLVRRICENCACEAALPSWFVQNYAAEHPELARGKARKANPEGCVRCQHSGYVGRIGVFELMVKSPELEAAIANRERPGVLEEIAAKNGFKPMIHSAIEHLVNGITSFEEIERVVLTEEGL